MVVELAGTTTVVLAGGGGLLLLIQPHKRPAAIISVVRVFIKSSRLFVSGCDCSISGCDFAQSNGGKTDAQGAWLHEAKTKICVLRGPT